MSIANRFLKLAALVALDKVMNKERSEELVKLLDDWKSERDKAKALAEAKKLAADTKAVAEAVDSVIGGSPGAVSKADRDNIEFAVASGIASLEEPPSEKAIEASLLPGRAKVFVILSDDHRLTGGEPGRFFHFSWADEGYRVRDYLGNRLLHPADRNPGTEGALIPAVLNMTVLEVWNASSVRIRSSSVEFGLGFGTKEQDRWLKVLRLLTESATQIRKK